MTKKHLADGTAQAVICNSGNANTCNANGAAGNAEITAAGADFDAFMQALNTVTVYLCPYTGEITREPYRNAEMAALYQDYLATGPVRYMAAIFRKMTASDGDAMQPAPDFYGPMYLLYSVYDGATEKEAVFLQFESHTDRFIARMGAF